MTVENEGNRIVRDHYREITKADIGEVARELLGDRVRVGSPALLRCDCPHHESNSRQSLHIMLDKQAFYCFGCRVGGDVLQLVEFIRTGQVTRGQRGPMPESHREARDFLAARVGLPPLSKVGLSPKQLADAEARRREGLRVQEVLTRVAETYHQRLRESPEVLEWFRTKYAISDETIDQLLIGYADNETDAIRVLRAEPHPILLRDLAATGAFLRKPQGGLRPFFRNRIVFPYWSGGRVVYMIGRRTPWTPDDDWEKPKYKKLPLRSKKHPYLSSAVRNDHLYNEDCLSRRPDHLIITEGVTDCISLMERGFAVVSPVTVRIKRADWERILPRLHRVKTVFLCMDNELSGVGLSGAIETAAAFAEREIEARVVVLPLGEKQRVARESVARFREEHPGEDPDPSLVAQAKLDVNGFFLEGGTATDFRSLLADARTPLELAIESLPTTGGESDRNKALDPILSVVAKLSPLEVDRHLRLIREHAGEPKIAMGSLRDQVKRIRKESRDRAVEEERKSNHAPPGSCKAAIEQAALESGGEMTQMAEAAFRWFCDNGGRFFRTRHGEPSLFFGDAVYWMDTSDHGRRRLYNSFLYKHTGIVPTTTGGRTFFEVLANLATEHGEVREAFTWLHTDISRHTIYLNLNNEDHEIVKITPEAIEVLKNGGNEDGVILDGSRKIAPIRYIPEADPEEVDRLIADMILKHLTCSQASGELILAWLACFPLLDFVGTRPMARFEGPAGSGKTTASKLISALVYGEPQQKKSTDAANYTDGSQNPLIVLDNIEAHQMTEELTSFLLTSITGIAKEKRKSGTDTETVIERTKCLLNTTGIEPLGGEMSEVLSRSFVVRFDMPAEESDCFLEAKVLAQIRENRDRILSGLMKKTQRILAMIQNGAHEEVMRLLHRALGDHGKKRCNDYLALMYLVSLAGELEEEVARALEELSPDFCDQVESLNAVSGETARESNPIATALAVLFKAYALAVKHDQECLHLHKDMSNVAYFEARYQLALADENTLEDVRSRDLFVALRRLARDHNISFPPRSGQQFAQRLANDIEIIQEAGFEITHQDLGRRHRVYTIRRLDG